MRVTHVDYSEMGIQMIVQERSSLKDESVYTRRDPTPRHVVLASHLMPPVTRAARLVSVDRRVCIGGLAEIQFSWKWRT